MVYPSGSPDTRDNNILPFVGDPDTIVHCWKDHHGIDQNAGIPLVETSARPSITAKLKGFEEWVLKTKYDTFSSSPLQSNPSSSQAKKSSLMTAHPGINDSSSPASANTTQHECVKGCSV